MVSEAQKEALIQAACQVRAQAYAPYSDYPVGAAILTASGQIYTGVNVENAVYGLGICAERAAVFKAVTAGERQILAVAVCTKNAGSPCGACRQVLSEFAGDVPVWMVDQDGNVRESTLGALIPDHFGAEHLV
ncbi:MAG: cytidine deaminase [Candidatus Promineifilaceae bacterium]|nr:cytidine deaminase [Candidatus Promineifilaceae bacterium]